MFDGNYNEAYDQLDINAAPGNKCTKVFDLDVN